MVEIGGYFSLELDKSSNNKSLHSCGLYLNSGRNALEYILSSLTKIDCLWIPFFTCEVILEPLHKLKIPYKFYSINEKLELKEDILLSENEYILFTNYYGIKDAYIIQLAQKYTYHLIVDNAQALYALPVDGIKTFYSPRKFVGIPDGGIVYMNNGININTFDTDVSYDRMSHLLKRIDLGAEAGYNDFKENSHKLENQPIKRMSNLTVNLLNSVNFEYVKETRRLNFQRLHEKLASSNKLKISDMDSFECPMVYPYFTDDKTLKSKLIKDKIFVATYWPNVLKWCMEDTLEYQLADRTIAIPIDQRYGIEEIECVIKKFDSINHV